MIGEDELVARAAGFLRDSATALRSGNVREALRRADCARRIAPDAPDVIELCARLWCSIGEHATAHALLSHADRSTAGLRAALVESLAGLGNHTEALAELARALQEFAVTERLAEVARSLVATAGMAFGAWVGFSPQLDLICEFRDGTNPGAVVLQGIEGASPVPRGEARGAWQSLAWPRAAIRELPRLSVSVAGVSVIGSPLRNPPAFSLDGRCHAEGGSIRGWAVVAWSDDAPDAVIAEDAYGRRASIRTRRGKTDRRGGLFSLNARRAGLKGDAVSLYAVMPDGTLAALPDSPVLMTISPAPRPPQRTPQPAGQAVRDISIVVPVFAGLDDTLRCLASVRATCPLTETIVVNDCSPDAELVARLVALAAEKAIRLLHNRANLGFPAAANRGMAAARRNDVVLLNADTEVYGDWLGRLRAAAYSAEKVGTATPFADEGWIVTYAPVSETMDGATAARIDSLAASVNGGQLFELPTGVGFCLYVRRDCIEDVGDFDAASFAAGYGEETDFCLRARARGWRHLLAADVFVRHRGARSFGERRVALSERNTRILNRRHPRLGRELERFLSDDPPRPARRKLSESLLGATDRRYAVVITLALPGGTARFVEERCEGLRQEGLTPLVVKPLGSVGVSPTCAAPGLQASVGNTPTFPGVQVSARGVVEDLAYRTPDEIGAFRSLLAGLATAHTELHHFLGHDEAMVEAVLSAASTYDAYIHDYGWICPRIDLVGSRGYCGEPAVSACAGCVRRNGSVLPELLTAGKLRQRSARWLAGARRVFVPTAEVASRIARHFPGVTPIVTAWQATGTKPSEGVAPTPKQLRGFDSPSRGGLAAASRPLALPFPSSLPERNGRIRVALIGAINRKKGYAVLLACARDAARRDLPLEFVVIGFTENDDALAATGRVFVTGRYAEAELPALIRREQPHLFFFPTVGPETWCYTLTSALETGLPILGFDLGAVGTRLSGLHRARLIAYDSQAKVCNRELINLGTAEALPESQAGASVLSPDLDADVKARGRPAVLETGQIMVADAATGEGDREQLTSSVRVFTLGDGLYAFTVRSPMAAKLSLSNQLTLPALYVSRAPGRDRGQVEFLPGPFVRDRWLSEPGDVVAARVTGGPVNILLTSLRAPGAPELTVEVQRLDRQESETGAIQRPAPIIAGAPLPAEPPPVNAVATEVALHIHRRGDVSYGNPSWAGERGQGLWIEGLSITPLNSIGSEDIEYKGLTASGVETPWIKGGELCGTRGMGMPLVGFAARVRPPAATRFGCEYSATFLSGETVGPCRNGAPCRASTPNDPLEAIQIFFLPRSPSSSPATSTAAPKGEPRPEKGAALSKPIKASAEPKSVPGGDNEKAERKKGKKPSAASVFRRR
jgi:GT2 family glycosyltransferase/glycosyltransferase involved in cell wall biosynthesis